MYIYSIPVHHIHTVCAYSAVHVCSDRFFICTFARVLIAKLLSETAVTHSTYCRFVATRPRPPHFSEIYRSVYAAIHR